MWRTEKPPPKRRRRRRGAPDSSAATLGDEHDDRIERGEIGERLDLHLLVEIGLGLAPPGDAGDLNSLRIERLQSAGPPAGGHHRVADPDALLLRHAVEDQG